MASMTSTRPSLTDLEGRDEFQARHIGPDATELAAMLARLGHDTLDGLIGEAVPAAIRSDEPLDLPPPLGGRPVFYLATTREGEEWSFEGVLDVELSLALTRLAEHQPVVQVPAIRFVDALSGQFAPKNRHCDVKDRDRPDDCRCYESRRGGPFERASDRHRAEDQADQHTAGVTKEYSCGREVVNEKACE